MPLRIAVLAKQVPRFDELRLDASGRLARDGVETEINPYCRRAVAKGVELAHAAGGSCTVFTLGPPQAEELLAEAIAWGADEGVLISDPAFAGSDTLATSRALAAAINQRGPFGLVLAGLNSVDGETGQVPPQLAELLGLPFLSGARELSLDGDLVQARCERDYGFVTAHLQLPALITAAERLCQPAKVAPAQRPAASARIDVVTAADVGAGPWGQQGSPTRVGEVRLLAHDRRPARLSGPLSRQVRHVAKLIRHLPERLPLAAPGAHVPPPSTATSTSGISPADKPGDPALPADSVIPVIAVIAEPGRPQLTRELLGASAQLAAQLGGRTALLATEAADPSLAWAQGADTVIRFSPERAPPPVAAAAYVAPAAEDVAAAIASWARGGSRADRGDVGADSRLPWAILAPSTSWGRELAGRLSVLIAAGLTGDAVALEVAGGRLVCWKPAFGGQLVAAITARSAVQMATIRPGVLTALRPREGPGRAATGRGFLMTRGRVTITGHVINDEPERLAQARAVVCVGNGVDPSRYGELAPLLDVLGAELAATRKVTDAGWLPRSRQVGITGRAVAPALYLLLGASGKVNHMVATRGAGLVVAVNSDPDAPVFDAVDVGIVADWAQFARLLTSELVVGEGPHGVPEEQRGSIGVP